MKSQKAAKIETLQPTGYDAHQMRLWFEKQRLDPERGQMKKEFNEPQRLVSSLPRLTAKGLGFNRFPMEGVLKQAMTESAKEFSEALSILQAMHQAGRREAGVFLLGLLAHSGDDWKIRTQIVKRLEGFNTKGCAEFLFGELKRVKSNNITRGYLGAVLDTLAGMPLELTRSELLDLTADNSFSQHMRAKFVDILDEASRRQKR